MSEPSAPSPRIDEAATMDVSIPEAMPEGGIPLGATVSRYVVLEEIGRGGMGRVLRAYDPKLQREVALKEVHAHQLDAEAATRLVAEARAMAKLSHPNVVAVYDVEALESGAVILVMEYIRGQTLRQWLSLSSPRQRGRIDGRQDRPWQQVVAHFVAAGRGLVAAHEAGLLHRDFKPTNVLVLSSRAKRAARAPDQSEGRIDGGSMDGNTVKVTDFGLAKPSGAPPSGVSLADNTSNEDLTEAGTIVGTPRYMAPEQHRGETLSPAADQYAFCVSLWEALCGRPPFAGKSMADDKASGPPPWPGTVHRSAIDPPLALLGSSGHSLRSGAQATPRPIVDAIVRGLSPQPVDRWPTMAALLEALAYDPARRRNRWLLGWGTLGALGLAGVSYGTWADARARRCSGAREQLAGLWDELRSAEVKAAILRIDKPYAPGAWARTQRELDAYASDWATMHTEACEATTIRGEQSPQMMDLRMGCLHRAAQELQATVETLADADDEVVRNAHRLTTGLRPLSRCANAEALAAAVEPPLPAETDAVETARLDLARAESLTLAGRYEAALAAVEAAKEALAAVEYGPVQTEVAVREGAVLDKLGRYEASEATLSEALTLGSRWRQADEMAVATTQLMYVVGLQQRRMEEGLRYWPLAEGLTRGEPKREARARNSFAAILYSQGKYEEAEAEQRTALMLWEAALGPDHPNVAVSRNNLAAVLYAQGKYAEVEAEQRAALSLRQTALGPDHPSVAGARNNLAGVLFTQGKHAEAEAEYRAALSVQEKALGPDHPDVAMSRKNLANALDAQGKYEEAETEYRAALSLREKALGPDHPDVAMSRTSLAIALRSQAKYPEAEAELRAALSLQEKALGADHPQVALSRINLAGVLADQEKYAEAEAEYRTALSHEEEALGPDHPHVASSRSYLAGVLLKVGRTAEALPLAEQAWVRHQRDDIAKRRRAQTAFLLARLLWTIEGPWRDRSRARLLAEDTKRSYRDDGNASEDNALEVQQWLDAHPLR